MNKPLVYIIDDDLELAKVIAQRFMAFGCEAKTFTESKSLFDAYSVKVPKLQMVDLNLGDGLSGFDIIKKIRTEMKLDLPILILTGDKDQNRIAHALEIGANEYIIKPPFRVDFKELISQFISTEELPENGFGSFQAIATERQEAILKFPLSIEEVHLTGISLISDHLIKKGAAFYLNGPELKKIFPSCERLFVRTINSAAKVINEQKKYQIQVEIDDSQEEALKELRSFLSAKVNQEINE